MPPGAAVYMSEKSAYVNTTLFLRWLEEAGFKATGICPFNSEAIPDHAYEISDQSVENPQAHNGAVSQSQSGAHKTLTQESAHILNQTHPNQYGDPNFEERLLQWYEDVDTDCSDKEDDVDESYAINSEHETDSEIEYSEEEESLDEGQAEETEEGKKYYYELAQQLVKPHLESRAKNEHISRKLRLSIYEILGTTPPEVPVVRVDRMEMKKKNCYICPYQKKRRTNFSCYGCQKPICLECSRKMCLNCVRNSSN
ncbi:DDE Tnp 1-like zinc-ribbon [Popillia japonica]|uniref:DDE Tnp 1-like zinc-ribbon n=1 Tax=Popillia japonica TaxID=7064 RepID=A0AAW1M0N2_POPJA